MYDIRQFRPTLYLLVALGFTGFAIATIAPLMWVLGMAGLLLNVWLVRSGRFRPLPRILANAATILAAIAAGVQAVGDPRPIFPIGNFLLVLQLIKLFEQRANRDFAQVLVLSLLMMVAAAISTASLIFGLLFLVYLLVSPYAALLFHLKVETDHAKRMMGLDDREADPMTLRQDQRWLNRSMARMTAVVAAFAIVMAIAVFLLFPRSSTANMLGWQFRPPVSATGMSDQMNMQSVARVQQNTAQIGTAKISRNGHSVQGGSVYLRGNVYDEYNVNALSTTRWSWSRQSSLQRLGFRFDRLLPQTDKPLGEATRGPSRPEDEQWSVEFTPLEAINVPFLICVGRATNIEVGRPIRLNFVAADQVIELDAPLYQPLTYKVASTLPIVAERTSAPGLLSRMGFRRSNVDDDDADNAAAPQADVASDHPRFGITPRVAEYARNPDVSGVDGDGRPLIDALGPPTDRPSPVAADVARSIERHLQDKFAYTLDLTDQRSKDDADDRDPIERFLYDSKKGWCEHFAGAMTLMCQSLGMKARLVSGFKCDEYNSMGDYWIVRQSHAHAWVEVLVRDGDRDVWQTFDPTSGRDAENVSAGPSVLTRIQHAFDYLEHTWATNVIAYDSSSQASLYDTVETKMVNASIKANSAVRDSGWSWRNWFDWDSMSKFSIGATVISTMIGVITFVGIALILWYLIGRIRLMRRARRIGLGGLDADEARRLARQLGFYDEMIHVLEQRRIVCPPHLTPLEFSRSLEFLSEEAYDHVVRLTEIFYRVRFGQAELSGGQRRALVRVVDRLRAMLLPQQK